MVIEPLEALIALATYKLDLADKVRQLTGC